MSRKRLLVTELDGAVLSILTDGDGKTVQVNAQTDRCRSLVGSISAARIKDVVPGLGGAFAVFADERTGFLQISRNDRPIYLNKCRSDGGLRQGDIILSQVKSDAVKLKDPVLTAKISIAGKYAVLTALSDGVRFSSKIKDEDFKLRVSECFPQPPDDHGIIIRTAAENVSGRMILRDVRYLEGVYEQLPAAKEKKTLLDSRDIYISDVIDCAGEYDEIVTDSSCCYLNIKQFLSEHYPEDLENLRFMNIREDMKTVYGIRSRMSEALGRKVNLKSGGFLIIEPTEALVAIDVNSGKSFAPDPLKINLEAARECARQMRIRNLSGIIMIDFINMKSRDDNDLLISEMKKLTADDPCRPKVCDLTGLGLLEITRKKVRRPLYEIMDIC